MGLHTEGWPSTVAILEPERRVLCTQASNFTSVLYHGQVFGERAALCHASFRVPFQQGLHSAVK